MKKLTIDIGLMVRRQIINANSESSKIGSWHDYIRHRIISNYLL